MQNYNIISGIEDISDESGPASEPVTLPEMKDYLRLGGFIDDDDSTAIPEFTDDDDLIEEMITAARQALEEELGSSIIQHSWKATGVTNLAGEIQLPYGPVTEITSVLDCNGDAIDHTDSDEVKLQGDFLKYPNQEDMIIEYTAGYASGKLPKPIVVEIKRMVAYMYENRGDEVASGRYRETFDGYKFTDNVSKYKRKSWLV